MEAEVTDNEMGVNSVSNTGRTRRLSSAACHCHRTAAYTQTELCEQLTAQLVNQHLSK